MRYDTIEVSKQNDVATIYLNRPEVHNAMNESLMTELTDCFKELSDDNIVRIIVLTGKGKSFCAGADLNWMKSMVNYSKEDNIKDSRLLLDLFETIYSCPKPVIGRINGHAFGGGLGLIAVCDIAISVPGLKFAFSEANLGIISSVISTYVAPRVSLSNMRRLFVTAERFDTAVARGIGLIDFVVSPEEFDSKVEYYIEQLRFSGPIAMAEVKNLIKNLREMHIDKYKEFTVEKISELRISEEGQEGINAFLEKRKPRWRE
ncbi:MAG: enoyl-CoA hydratase/isomerase family protein [Thermoplasmatales archaeon]|nr:enoyl-CoA hydratase/isomerase family protein [Thermoplasmatales archaeon]